MVKVANNDAHVKGGSGLYESAVAETQRLAKGVRAENAAGCR
jgi:hypothetical protein